MKVADNKVSSLIAHFKEALADIYPTKEIEGFIRLSFEEVLGFSTTDLITKKEEEVSESEMLWLFRIVKALKTQEPIQYILGKTEFYGLSINVAPGVLIPRQETEELVDWIIKEHPNAEKILDIGTGSGCIALALKKGLPKAEITAWDISEDALEFARGNAMQNKLNVFFEKIDILNGTLDQAQEKYDLVVSNPPYVTMNEKKTLDRNVIDYEPHEALFVPDDDPLVFYRAIGSFALQHLAEGGSVYFEINEHLGPQVVGLLKEVGFQNIVFRMDLSGKDRMISAS